MYGQTAALQSIQQAVDQKPSMQHKEGSQSTLKYKESKQLVQHERKNAAKEVLQQGT
jgi:hypothetical protein